MRVKLAYGRSGLEVQLPDERTDVLEPLAAPGIDEQAALRAALASPLGCPPLRQMVTPHDRVAIVVNDGTRPMPSARALPALLEALAAVPRAQIVILVATGTHRANTVNELDEMLGPAIARDYRVLNHDARDPQMLRSLGRTRRGHPIWLNRHYLDATIRISTGFVEPHFFAGFSGGPKPIMPGLAGLETVLHNHGPAMIGDSRAAFGILDGNPIHQEQLEIALLAPPTLSINVALNGDHQITGLWAGEMVAVHRAAVEFVRRTAMHRIDRLYEVVLTTNSGYPLDQNLYQAVKGMSAAARAVIPGGSIVLAAACSDGLPSHGRYAQILQQAPDLHAVLSTVEASTPPIADGWQAQIQAQIQQRAAVSLYSTLSDDTVRRMHLQPCHNIEQEVMAALTRHGPQARLLVLPQGPQSVCELAARQATSLTY